MHVFNTLDNKNILRLMFIQVSSMLPQVLFKEQLVRVFLRPSMDTEKDKEAKSLLQQGFKEWCQVNTMQSPAVSTIISAL
jgi:hypothetical protein